jgi:5'-nucleotidase
VVDTRQQQGLRVVQATSYGRGVSVVDVVLDPATRDIDRTRTASRNIAVVNRARGKYLAVPKDPRVAELVAEYAELAAPRANRAVGSIVASIAHSSPDGAREAADSVAGRLIADAQLAATAALDAGGAQAALTNPGGIRAALPCTTRPPCIVTYGQAFTVQPFGNNLVVMTLTGQQLKALLEDQQKSSAKEPRFLQPSRTLTYTWKRGAPYGERVTDLRVNEVAVMPEARYRVTVNNYPAEGGDGFRRLRDGSDRSGGMLDVDALVGFLQTHPGYAPDRTPRIMLVDD